MRLALVWMIAALAALPMAAQHESVHDADASLIAVAQRQQELHTASSQRVQAAVAKLSSCLKLPLVAPPQGRIVIPHHYLQGSSGPTNPAEAQATAVYGAFERRITAGMNQFVATGSHAEAACAQQQIHQWAQAGALLEYDAKESSQAWFQVEWTLSATAITESVLVNDRDLQPAGLQQDKAWLNRVAHRMIDFEQGSPSHNNHHAWRAIGAAATGVLSKDDALFQWGLAVFREEVDQIDSRGAFPLEMKREENSIHYQAFALQPLIPIAEFAARQGLDLYSYRSPSGKTIGDAVRFLTQAVADPGVVKVYTATPQKLLPLAPDFYSFGEFYIRRFPARAESVAMLASMTGPTSATRIGGNTTVLAAAANGENPR